MGQPNCRNMPNEVLHFLNHRFDIIRKKKRRALSVKLQPEANQVLANFSISPKQIEIFLLSKKTWLEKNLKIIETQKLNTPTPTFQEGSLFPFFGELKYFKFVVTKLKKISFAEEDGFLICHCPTELNPILADNSKLKLKLTEFYKSCALAYLENRAHELSEITGLRPNKIKIQTARRRWGSCTSERTILLNWKLIVFPKPLIDYVIIHELCHLQYMNHSEKFWDLVQFHCPQFEDLEAEIKNQARWTYFL